MSDTLKELGWNAFFENGYNEYLRGAGAASEQAVMIPARVISVSGTYYKVSSEAGEFQAGVSGRLQYTAGEKAELPAVGDWVVIGEPGRAGGTTIIHAVLPRKSRFSRKVPERKTEEQVLAANIDTAIIVTALDSNYRLRRIERYLTLVYNSGAVPLIVLSKADLCDDVDGRKHEVEEIAFGVPVLTVSAVTREGLQELESLLKPGTTAALLGSSGVGKSSIINALIGDEKMKVNAIRVDGKGRHTTTHRELVELPSGAMLIDNPGMRELQLWSDDESVEEAFGDIVSLADGCRFSDCTHMSEPGCAVLSAVDEGTLDGKRLESYHKLQREIRHLEMRQGGKAALAEKQRWKTINKWQKEYMKFRHR